MINLDSSSGPQLEDVDAISTTFGDAVYICTARMASVVYLAAALNIPSLVEGRAGVGKTELAKTGAEVIAKPLVRLQC